MSKKSRARKVVNQSHTAPTINEPRKWIIGLILGITFFAFSNSLANGFAYDDTTQILNNPFIRSLSNIPTAMVTEAWFWRTQMDKDPTQQDKPSTPYYRPTIMVYLMLGWQLFGASAFGWHFANILMHMAVVYFVFLILERITKDLRLSAIASLLFAIHPLRSESVAWISGLTDLFLALFLLPSFYLYLLYREGGKSKHLIAAMGLFLVAAFSKEPAVCLPIFIGAYELFISNQDKPFTERLRPALKYGLMFIAVSIVYFGMRQYALGFLLSDSNYVANSFVSALMTIPIVVCKYLGLLLWPVDLSLFHATPVVTSPLDVRFILPTLALIIIAAGLWAVRNSLIARFGILWFAINLLPVLNLRAFDPNFMVQERYVYIPSIGFSLLVAMALAKMPIEKWLSINNRRTAQVVIVALICLVLTGKTFAQNTVWEDDFTVYTHGAQVAADQPMPHFILGHQFIKAQQADKAVESLEKYMQLDPNNLIVITNLASAHLVVYETSRDRAHIDRARALCEKGLNIHDQNAALWDTLGRLYTFDTEFKNFNRARAFFNRAIQIQPEMAIANLHLGATYVLERDPERALPYLEQARNQQPDFPDTYKFLAVAYQLRGQFQDAINNYDRYLQLQPNAIDAPVVNKEISDLRAQMKNATPKS